MAETLERCRTCAALLDEEDLFCANCGASAPDRDERTVPRGAVMLTHHFQCQSCGASMSYDARAGALRCPYCGSTQLSAREDVRVWAPNRVVPFTLDRQQAVSALRRWLGRGIWRPMDLARMARVAKMTGVYVPYWLFSAETFTYWNADVSPPPVGSRADWYPVTGQHHGRFQGLLVGASATLSPDETDAICPYDMSEAEVWDTANLEEVNVEPCTVPRKYARPLARQGLEQCVHQAIQAESLGQRHRNLRLNVRIEQLRSEPILLPVWVVVYRYRGKPFRFLINGQSGRATGEAPLSKWKVAGAVLAVIALIVVVILFALLGR